MVAKLTKFFFVMFLVLLSACREVELYQELSEQDANEMMVILSENKIEAIKKKEIRQNEISYSVLVKQDQLGDARALLVRNHLPRAKELGLPGVYKEKGLIPTPDEQKARYLLALKGEIINSLERIPEIVDVDVVLNVPEVDEFASPEEKERKRPTASAVVRAKPSLMGAAAVTENKIQQFVANAVEGLNPRDVSVILSYIGGTDMQSGTQPVISVQDPLKTLPASTSESTDPTLPGDSVLSDSSLLGLKMDSESSDKLRLYLLMFFGLVMVLATGLIIAMVQAVKYRKRAGSNQEHAALEGRIAGGRHELGEGER